MSKLFDLKAYMRGWREKHPNYMDKYHTPQHRRESNLWTFYRLRPEDYDRMYLEQEGRCAICGRDEAEIGERLCVDHNHQCCRGNRSCGKCVRGLLCRSCNSRVERTKDVEFIVKANLYLTKFRKIGG